MLPIIIFTVLGKDKVKCVKGIVRCVCGSNLPLKFMAFSHLVLTAQSAGMKGEVRKINGCFLARDDDRKGIISMS